MCAILQTLLKQGYEIAPSGNKNTPVFPARTNDGRSLRS